MSSPYDTQALARPSITRLFPLKEASGSTCADVTANADHLTITGGVTLGATTLVVSDGETAASFDGSSGYFQGTSSLITSPPFRLSVILKTAPSAGLQSIFCNRDSLGQEAYINPDGSITWYSNNSTSPVAINSDPTLGSVSDGVAHQVDFLCSADVANAQWFMIILRDNVIIAISASIAYNPISPTGASAMLFGQRFGGSYFAGTMQKIVIYSAVNVADIFADRIPFVGQTIPGAPTLPLFNAVPYSWPAPGDPLRANFVDEIQLCRNGQRRWCLIGDSVSTIPGSGGRAFVPQLIVGLGGLFGGIAGTPLTGAGSGIDGFCIQGSVQGTTLSPRITTALGNDNQLPPGTSCTGLQPLASMGGLGVLDCFSAINTQTTINDVYGLTSLPATGVTIELVGSAAATSGEIAYQSMPTPGPFTDYFAGILIAPAGVTSMGLQQAVASGHSRILTQSIPGWTPGNAVTIQARVVCQDGAAQCDYVGKRVINPASVGVVLDDCSAGGYAAYSWFGPASGGTGNHGKCHDFMTAMAHDLYIINLGRNDSGSSTVAQFIVNLYSPTNAGILAGGPSKGLIGEIEYARGLAGLQPALYIVVAPPAFGDSGATNQAVQRSTYDQIASGLMSLAQSFPTLLGASRMLFLNTRRRTHDRGWTWQSETIAGLMPTNDKGAWTAGTYVPGDLVAAFATDQPPFYVCIKGHTADSTNQPGLAASTTAFFKYWRPVRTHTSDGTHDGPVGGYMEAMAIVDGLAGYDVTSPSMSDIQAAMTAQGFMANGVIGPAQSNNNTGQTTAIPTSSAGTGTKTMTINVKDATTSANIVGASVTVTGSATATTDTNGNATVMLNAGTYSVGITAAGYLNSLPSSQVVNSSGNWVSSGTSTLALTITSSTIITPPATGQIWGVLQTLDMHGNPLAGVTVSFQMTDPPTGNTGNTWPTSPVPFTSDSGGNIAVEMPMGSVFTGETAGGAVQSFAVPTSGTQFNVPSILGRYT